MAELPPLSGDVKKIGDALAAEAPKIDLKAWDEALDALAPTWKNELNFLEKHMVSLAGDIVGKTITGVVAMLLGVLSKTAEASGLIIGKLDAHRKQGQVGAYDTIQPIPLGPGDIAHMVLRKDLSLPFFRLECQRNGISEERADILINASRAVLTEPTLIASLTRGNITENEADERMGFLGYFPDEIDIIKRLRFTLLSASEDIVLWLRDEMTESDLDARLKEHGFRDFDVEHIKRLAFFIPPVSDLIRMVSREAFEPDQIARLGLGDEFPEEFALWAKRQGISRDWAEKYWFAHWDQPSMNMVYEMFHRQLIDEETVREHFRVVEIPPYWRENLIQIAFNPLTRVDVRRMYGLGVLTEEEVTKAYRDIGYSPENAARLTDFTVADIIQVSVSTIRARMYTLFRRGVVSEAEFRAFLGELRYPAERIDIIVAQQKLLKSLEHEEIRMRGVRNQYLKHLISLQEAGLQLAAFGIPSDNIPDILTDWATEKAGRVTHITIRDLHKAFKDKQVIDEEEFRRLLRERGMRERDIDILVALDTITTEEAPLEGGGTGGSTLGGGTGGSTLGGGTGGADFDGEEGE